MHFHFKEDASVAQQKARMLSSWKLYSRNPCQMTKKKKRWREINKNIWYFSDSWAFPSGSDGKKREICLQCRRPRDETQLWLLGREDPLQEGMAIHSSILAWRIPWTEEQLTLSLSLIHIVSTNLLLTPDNPGVHTSLKTAGQNTGIKED